MKKRLMTLLSVAVAASFLFSACASGGGDKPATGNAKDNTIIVGIDNPDGVFNPLYAESAYDKYITDSMFDGLLEIAADGSPTPALAAALPEISEDKKTYTFTLKDNLKFADGTAVTTEDVAFTFTVLADPAYDGPSDIVSAVPLLGAKAYNDGTATSVEGINVIDEKTIAFTFAEVNAKAIWIFGGDAGILSKAYYGANYEQGKLDYMSDLHSKPMGTGQFVFKSYAPSQEVVLTANKNYFKGAPKVDNLVFKVTSQDTRMQLLQSQEIDMDMVTVNKDNVEELESTGFMTLNIFPTNGYGYIGLNFADERIADKAVRHALTYGLNRAAVAQAVFSDYAKVINIPQSNLSWAYTENNINKYEYDTEKAKQILEEAGWVVGADGIREKDGKRLEFTFSATTPNAVNAVLVPIAVADWEKLGVKLNVEELEFNAVREKMNRGDFDMFFMAWGLTPDPDSVGVYGTDGPQNRTAYSNAKVDELFKKGLETIEIEGRKAIYHELYQVMNEDLPYIFMYQRSDMWAVNNRIEGFEVSPYRYFSRSLYKMSIKK
jgi:peptide/nickel transport system substrate-binding protein